MELTMRDLACNKCKKVHSVMNGYKSGDPCDDRFCFGYLAGAWLKYTSIIADPEVTTDDEVEEYKKEVAKLPTKEWLSLEFNKKYPESVPENDVLARIEIRKCIDNPYYFYTKHVTIDGKPATTGLTEEQFNKEFRNQEK